MTIVPMTADHGAFVFPTFDRWIRRRSTYVDGLTVPQVAALLTNLLKDGWRVDVCQLEEDLAVGWILHDARAQQHLGWLHVKGAFRGQGYARAMLAAAGISHHRRVTSPFCPNRGERAPMEVAFRPYLACGTLQSVKGA